MTIPAFSKSYGGRTVLRMPEFELPAGSVTAVIGANGSGKTTLARILAGTEKPDGPARRPIPERIGYLPQKSFAFRMSTERNVLTNGGDRDCAARLINALGLRALAGQPAKRLSGGETAKMALARLLMGDYELLILDEPTAAMDMESTLAAEALIRACTERNGCAVLLITHSVQQARRLADRVLFLRAGTLAEQGAAKTLLESPVREETRRFLEFYGA